MRPAARLPRRRRMNGGGHRRPSAAEAVAGAASAATVPVGPPARQPARRPAAARARWPSWRCSPPASCLAWVRRQGAAPRAAHRRRRAVRPPPVRRRAVSGGGAAARLRRPRGAERLGDERGVPRRHTGARLAGGDPAASRACSPRRCPARAGRGFVERTVSWVAWIAVLLWLSGLLPVMLAQMDGVRWKIGGAEVSLRNMVEGADQRRRRDGAGAVDVVGGREASSSAAAATTCRCA